MRNVTIPEFDLDADTLSRGQANSNAMMQRGIARKPVNYHRCAAHAFYARRARKTLAITSGE